MKHKAKVLQLSFLDNNGGIEAKVSRRLDELQIRLAELQAEAKKIIPQGTKLLNYYEQKSIEKQIELLNWLLDDS